MYAESPSKILRISPFCNFMRSNDSSKTFELWAEPIDLWIIIQTSDNICKDHIITCIIVTYQLTIEAVVSFWVQKAYGVGLSVTRINDSDVNYCQIFVNIADDSWESCYNMKPCHYTARHSSMSCGNRLKWRFFALIEDVTWWVHDSRRIVIHQYTTSIAHDKLERARCVESQRNTEFLNSQ